MPAHRDRVADAVGDGWVALNAAILVAAAVSLALLLVRRRYTAAAILAIPLLILLASGYPLGEPHRIVLFGPLAILAFGGLCSHAAAHLTAEEREALLQAKELKRQQTLETKQRRHEQKHGLYAFDKPQKRKTPRKSKSQSPSKSKPSRDTNRAPRRHRCARAGDVTSHLTIDALSGLPRSRSANSQTTRPGRPAGARNRHPSITHTTARRCAPAVLSRISGAPTVAATTNTATPPPVTVIRPTRGFERLGLGALFAHRDLLMMLAMRDIKVRYKQAVLGVAWAILQPLAMAGILWLFFGILLGMDAQVAPTPYLVFVLAGVLPWTLFESAVTGSSNSVVANAGIVRKVYFPRLIIPLAAAGAPLVDYVLGLAVLILAMLVMGVAFSWQIVLLPLLVASTLIAVMGVGILLSALTVAYRDFRHIVPFLLRLLFFMTPVIYPVAVMPERFRWVLALNPVGGTISAFRAAVPGAADRHRRVGAVHVHRLCLPWGRPGLLPTRTATLRRHRVTTATLLQP